MKIAASNKSHHGGPFGRTRRLQAEGLEVRRMFAITVNTLNDFHVNGLTTLREAIAAATPGETISFAAALTSGGPATIQLSNLGQLTIDKNLAIAGPGPDLLAVRAYDPTPMTKNGDGSRIFNVDDATSSARTVSVSGLTLTGGDLNGKGGAIYSAENLTLDTCVVAGNSTSDVDGNSAGAIYNKAGARRSPTARSPAITRATAAALSLSTEERSQSRTR